MTTPTFATADIPADVPPILTGADGITEPTPDTPSQSSDLTCETCGTPLVYAGRGRRPRFCDEHRRTSQPRTPGARSPSRATGVEDALARMEMAYGLVATGLMMVNPVAAAEFAGRIDGTQVLNRQAFDADPRLVKRINATSQNAGTLMFIGANVMLVGPTLRLVYEQGAAQARERKAQTAPPSSPFGDFGNGAA